MSKLPLILALVPLGNIPIILDKKMSATNHSNILMCSPTPILGKLYISGRISSTSFNKKKYNLDELRRNLKIANSFMHLQNNWNNNSAPSFNNDLIERTKNIIGNLSFQPQIFPTARKSVQLEYEKTNGDYLEIEIFENNRIVGFEIKNGIENEFEINDDNSISISVENFYA